MLPPLLLPAASIISGTVELFPQQGSHLAIKYDNDTGGTVHLSLESSRLLPAAGSVHAAPATATAQPVPAYTSARTEASGPCAVHNGRQLSSAALKLLLSEAGVISSDRRSWRRRHIPRAVNRSPSSKQSGIKLIKELQT